MPARKTATTARLPVVNAQAIAASHIASDLRLKAAAEGKDLANAPTEPIVLARHTPGPWRASNDGSTVYVHDAAMVAATAHIDGYPHYPLSGDECAANARLIAAAPEMLAALREVVALAYGLPIGTQENVHAAITKAMGVRS